MSWLKRNLYFLVGGIVAVALLGLAGFYFFSKWNLDRQKLEQLEKAYGDWERIATLPKHPGNDQVNNIKLAREQREQVRAVIQKVDKHFAPIPPIPDPTDEAVTKEGFASAFRSALRKTIDQLQKDATSSGVSLPPNSSFSFKAQQNLFNMPPGSLGPLSVQLGEIKAICAILFQAKINSLDNVRRERVSSDDLNGPVSDYLESTLISVTNELAILTPYEVTFKCFTAELAAVLAGFGSQPSGFIVKAINVEPGAGMAATMTPEMAAAAGDPYAAYRGIAAAAPATVPGAAATPRGALPTVLDEKQLKVTMVLNVVKLLPKE